MKISVLIAVHLILAVSVSYGQTAQISGAITDSSGGAVPEARITVVNTGTEIARRTTSNETGNYFVPLLSPGNYRILVQREGMMPLERSGIVLTVDQVLRLDFILEVGEVTSRINVTAQEAALDQATSSLGQILTASSVQDLPLSGRNFVRLAQLAAGANEGAPQAMSSGTRPDDRRRTSAVSVNGQRDYVNSFLIDGMDNNERSVGTAIIKPSMDALAEFRVQTNLYTAEYGRTAGGVINLVTKSGSNSVHGSLFEFLRNDDLDARNYFALPGPKPPFRQNQFGGSLGGPLKLNRTFYFVDYEGFRQRQSQTVVSTVPTEDARKGAFSGLNAVFDPLTTRVNPQQAGAFIRDRFPADQIPASRFDKVAEKLVALYPQAQRAVLANNFTYVPVRKQREDIFDLRADHMFTEGKFGYVRYSFNDNDTLTPTQLPPVGQIQAGGDAGSFAGPSVQRSQSLHFNYVQVIRPNLLMELKAGYSRFALHANPANEGNTSEHVGIAGANSSELSRGLSAIQVAGFRGLGDSNFIPLYNINNLFQHVGSISWNHSNHNFKFGADIKRRQVSYYHSPQPRGVFAFNANFTNDPSGTVARSGNSVASLLLGFPANTTRNLFLIWPGYRTTETGVYAQDDWRVARWLTLNIGLRYDVFTPFTEAASRLANVDLVGGRIIASGKDGVSQSAGVRTDWTNLAPRFGFAAHLSKKVVMRGGFGFSYYPGTYGVSAFLRNPPFTSLYTVAATPLTPINSISQGLPAAVPTSPESPQGNLAPVSPDARSSYVQQYNLTLQAELFRGIVWRGSYVGGLGRAQAYAQDLNLAPPGSGAIGPRRPFASVFPNVSSITQFQTVGISNYHAFQMSLERRLSVGLDLAANYTYARLIDDTNILNGGKPGSSTAQLSNARWLERGNSDLDIRHRLTLMATYEIPFPQLSGAGKILASGWVVNCIGVFQTGLPFTVVNAGARANTGGSDRPDRVSSGVLTGGQRSIDKWFDTGAFIAQPLFSIGNSGRNILYAPGQKTIDFSVLKNFPIREDLKLQLRGEVFNITNTPNFDIPAGALGSPGFGTISGMSANPRQMQIGLKLLF
ncbi:MAG: TonB-dependent receptor [Bryobacterales bacterium]|nr:TonB-dependent receptor [Bryobacterales bacterium]